MDYYIKRVKQLNQAQLLSLQQLLLAWQDKADIRPYLYWEQIQQRSGSQALDWLCYYQEELIGYAGIFTGGAKPPQVIIVIAPQWCKQGIATLLWRDLTAVLAIMGQRYASVVIPNRLGNFTSWLKHQHAQHSCQHIELRCTASPEFTHTALQIRQANTDDVAIAAELHALGFNRSIAQQQQFYNSYLHQTGVVVWLGLLPNNTAVALLCCETLPLGERRLVNFTVHPKYRGQGYAKQMLLSILQQLQPSSKQPLYIETLSNDSRSLKLYQACGFQKMTDYHHYQIPVGDIMPNSNPQHANMQHLLVELQPVREALYTLAQEALAEQTLPPLPDIPDAPAVRLPTHWQTLCQLFNLNLFSRQLLLLCLGQELIPEFPILCAYALGDKQANYPTLDLALRLFNGHPGDLAPESPLRYWQLVELRSAPGITLVRSPLKITERILHYLLGVATLAPEIKAWARPTKLKPLSLPSYQTLAKQVHNLWQTTTPPLVQLVGSSYEQAEQVIAWLADETGRSVLTVDLKQLPFNHQQTSLLLLLQREILLGQYLVLIDASLYHEPQLSLDVKQQLHTFLNAIEPEFAASIVLYTSQRLADLTVLTQSITLNPLPLADQFSLWQNLLPAQAAIKPEELSALCQQFSLSPRQITAVCQQYDLQPKSLWQLCQEQLNQHYSDKIRVITTQMQWSDLVLGQKTQALLTQLTQQVKYRHQVYHELGFAKYQQRGLGIAALFTGPSGTGKTTAAEIMAQELQLALLHVDLSGLVSKYVGETEKNLREVFQQAEKSGAILLFDEADALFGKRSNQVQSSNDRHSNMEVSYLLQQMEAYRGLSILTTNLQANMDEAFVRRFRFIIPFTVPTPEQRLAIWQQAFPKTTSLANLDWAKLANLELTGANIRSAAMNAAFLAITESKSVEMQHILTAVQQELTKQGKLFSSLI